MHSIELIDKFTEFETKYRTDPSHLVMFKYIVSKLQDLKGFIYVEGTDDYFKKLNGDCKRYRRPALGTGGNRAEVTKKVKPKDAKNNNKRKELNVRVDNTPEDVVIEDILEDGYKFNFRIYKLCHIYNFKDATVVFYTVYDTTDGEVTKVDHFIEIEVDEDTIHLLTEEQAWQVISKYESALAPIGVTPQKRLRKSLQEMYERPYE